MLYWMLMLLLFVDAVFLFIETPYCLVPCIQYNPIEKSYKKVKKEISLFTLWRWHPNSNNEKHCIESPRSLLKMNNFLLEVIYVKESSLTNTQSMEIYKYIYRLLWFLFLFFILFRSYYFFLLNFINLC